MSPERTSPNGQYRTDIDRAPIGRLRVTYGYTLKEHHRAVALIEELFDNQQHDVLRALQKKRGEAGRVMIVELLAAKRVGRHKRDDVLIDLRLQRPLWATLEAMAKARPGGEKHRTRLMTSLKKFAATPIAGALGPEATVQQLADVDWRALRPSFDSPSDWMHLRKAIGATLSALLEDTLHPFRRAVMKRIAREKDRVREVDVTVEQFWALVAELPEHARAGIVTLAVTGMRLETEYMRCVAGDKRPAVHGVYCPGSKTADASGVIPIAPELWAWVDAGIPAPLQHRWLRTYFHRAAIAVGLGTMIDDPRGRTRSVTVDGVAKTVPLEVYRGIRLHDLRHLALQLALDGGAKINDVQSFARHADPAMTMRYLVRGQRRRAADAIGRSLIPPVPTSPAATPPATPPDVSEEVG